MSVYFVGVDVGTSSVRAALVNDNGKILDQCVEALTIWNPQPGHYEQSSEEVWNCVSRTIQAVTKSVEKESIKGIGFDATCSLVLLGEQDKQLSISTTDDPRCNIMMWMDHRAKDEADFINETRNECLNYVGGKVSLEMQIPKLIWLKRNKPEIWEKTVHFMDLTDFLTYKATGSTTRSLCSLVCKWNYLQTKEFQGWNIDFFKQVGLEDLAEENFERLGTDIKSPGTPSGNGLTNESAENLNLSVGTPVAISLIDAHSGTIGCLSCKNDSDSPLNSKMAIIAGTSACHMILSEEEKFIQGVWGPYRSAILKDWFLNEAGQSAVAKLIDYVVDSHPSKDWIKEEAKSKKKHDTEILHDVLKFMSSRDGIPVYQLAKKLHICPDFHGNRSPLADSNRQGMMVGLSLNSDVEDLAIKYLATIQALAYGTRHIIETIKENDINIRTLHICGGLSKNQLFLQTLADVCQMNIIVPDCQSPVLLGAAILGACASNYFTSLLEGTTRFASEGRSVRPLNNTKGYHDNKYAVFLRLLKDQEDYINLMEN
ncbi:DgyrCDS2631 [Dimorphilus gyrociliatus]|uniref:FGGY carbohydrate kinase domain-containing protein n=1 Tax=Dimorphilus gyrociliatus TaxID=2664684 RepID=A0A7I8VB24_9ANNE|nr:DgyrCDS2631 [Dimorphilus gyrociliatus]